MIEQSTAGQNLYSADSQERLLRFSFQSGEQRLPQLWRGQVRFRMPLDADHPVVVHRLDGLDETVIGHSGGTQTFAEEIDSLMVEGGYRNPGSTIEYGGNAAFPIEFHLMDGEVPGAFSALPHM